MCLHLMVAQQDMSKLKCHNLKLTCTVDTTALLRTPVVVDSTKLTEIYIQCMNKCMSTSRLCNNIPYGSVQHSVACA
jgi:hypothetical protein